MSNNSVLSWMREFKGEESWGRAIAVCAFVLFSAFSALWVVGMVGGAVWEVGGSVVEDVFGQEEPKPARYPAVFDAMIALSYIQQEEALRGAREIEAPPHCAFGIRRIFDDDGYIVDLQSGNPRCRGDETGSRVIDPRIDGLLFEPEILVSELSEFIDPWDSCWKPIIWKGKVTAAARSNTAECKVTGKEAESALSQFGPLKDCGPMPCWLDYHRTLRSMGWRTAPEQRPTKR